MDFRGVTVRVQDSGAGIPAHLREAVFEPFVQGDNSTTRVKEGAGLGLAISRRFARLLGGDIELETDSDRGCMFTLRLPCMPEAAEQPPA